MSYFGIGIFHSKTVHNLGTLWRSAHILGASFVFTIGKRYIRQSSDTTNAVGNIPYFDINSFEDFKKFRPFDCALVGVELSDEAQPLSKFTHPKRAIYILGAEDHGLTPTVLEQCQYVVKMPTKQSLNVAVAGSIVMYDRVSKEAK